VESGPTFLDQLLMSKALDGIYLSITEVVDGENPINIPELLDKFSEVTRSEIEGTIFIEARKPI